MRVFRKLGHGFVPIQCVSSPSLQSERFVSFSLWRRKRLSLRVSLAPLFPNASNTSQRIATGDFIARRSLVTVRATRLPSVCSPGLSSLLFTKLQLDTINIIVQQLRNSSERGVPPHFRENHVGTWCDKWREWTTRGKERNKSCVVRVFNNFWKHFT